MNETTIERVVADPYQAPAIERPRRIGMFSIVATALVGLVLVIGLVLASGFRSLADSIPTPGDLAAVFEPEPYQEIGPVVITAIRNLSELTTVESVHYTIVEKGTDAGWLSWARNDSVRLLAVAKIGAGVNLGEVMVRDVELDERGVVEITVPRAVIQYVAPDNEATQVIERDLGLFTKGDPELESEVRRIADDVLVQSALDGGILEQAEANARTVLTGFLMGLGYRDVVVTFAN